MLPFLNTDSRIFDSEENAKLQNGSDMGEEEGGPIRDAAAGITNQSKERLCVSV
jgi:hypothetical protein